MIPEYEAEYDLLIIGAGFAGLAAALFASRRGLKTALTGSSGALDHCSGLIDLMAVHPIEEGKCWRDPWAAIQALRQDCPKHPYTLLTDQEIETALDEFQDFLASQGLAYQGRAEQNINILTPAGTTKPTFLAPASVWLGCLAREGKAPTLLIDFKGLKGFSARQVVEMQKDRWPGLRALSLPFPGLNGELYPEHMAWTLSEPSRREELAASLSGHIKNAQYLGFPAVLGINNPAKVVAHLEELTGKKIFEIPTMPPSTAGARLKSVFERGLGERGVAFHRPKTVLEVQRLPGGDFLFLLGGCPPEVWVRAKSAILASGRFLAQGLRAGRAGLEETVFGLPVTQPQARDKWHRQDFFSPRGHAINQAGVETESQLRPLGQSGVPAYANLHAAGAILAHQDWARMKCGAGLAIATAYKAVSCLAP